MTPPLSIAIATFGRFHVLDLARELHALGHRVRFYSDVPKARALAFGLSGECHVNLFPALAPFAAWQRFAPGYAPAWREIATYRALNRAVEAVLQPCDVFIAMSGMYLEAPQFARDRFGAKFVIVRGSKHILAQDAILADLPGAKRPSQLTIERELAGYEQADMIDVPSAHAAASFCQAPQLTGKIVVNPYGVDLDMFPQHSGRDLTRDEDVQFLYVGTWSLQKGCDLLAEAMVEVAGVRVRHVGPIGDAPRAEPGSAITHVGVVDQSALSAHYRAADALILPSRQDGFGMVLNQALASGLAVLGSTETGAPDLKARPALADRVEVVETDDLGALVDGLVRMRNRLRKRGPLPPLDPEARAELSWQAYAQRYDRNLRDLLDCGKRTEATFVPARDH